MERLNDTFFYNLEKSIRTYRHYFSNRLRQNGFEITLDQWITLNMIIDYPDASQIEIAERVFKDKASITRIIDLLMRDGYLMRQKNEQDARKSRLQLTKKGKITMQRLNKLVPSFRKDALKGIGPNEIRVALQLIRKLGYNCS